MNSALIKSSVNEERKKNQLKKAIFRKRQRLVKLTAQFEMLKMDVELIKHEYDVRIGRLYLKDNHLDIEIIRFQNIKRLMKEGKTYDEAVLSIEEEFFPEEEAYRVQNEEIDSEEEFLTKRAHLPEDTMTKMKALWKKLIIKFHPDLTLDPTEKAKRETFMKKINQAYAENNYDALKTFESEIELATPSEMTVERLEEVIVEIENMIINIIKLDMELKKSEWFGWKKSFEKAKKKNEDVFKDLERKLLEDIVRKINILNALKQSIGVKVVS